MAIIPSKQLHRSGPMSDLLANLSEREIGFCEDDNRCYICVIDHTKSYGEPGYKRLVGLGDYDHIVPDPTKSSIFMGYKVQEDDTSYTFGWKPATFENSPLDSNTILLSRIDGKGILAEYAKNTNVRTIEYGVTQYASIISAVNAKLIAILVDSSHNCVAPLANITERSCTFRSSADSSGKFYEYTVTSENVWTVTQKGLIPLVTENADPAEAPTHYGYLYNNSSTGDIWIALGTSDVSDWKLIYNRNHDLIVQIKYLKVSGSDTGLTPRNVLCDRQNYSINNGNIIFKPVTPEELAKWFNRGDVIQIDGAVASYPWGDRYHMYITEVQCDPASGSTPARCTNIEVRGYKYSSTEELYWSNLITDYTDNKVYMEFQGW